MTAFSRWAVATAKQSAKESGQRAFILDAEATALKSFEIIEPADLPTQCPENIQPAPVRGFDIECSRIPKTP